MRRILVRYGSAPKAETSLVDSCGECFVKDDWAPHSQVVIGTLSVFQRKRLCFIS